MIAALCGWIPIAADAAGKNTTNIGADRAATSCCGRTRGAMHAPYSVAPRYAAAVRGEAAVTGGGGGCERAATVSTVSQAFCPTKFACLVTFL
jgi:hypothetical protein